MTPSDPQTPELCSRCGSRPAISPPGDTPEALSNLHLCEQCFDEEVDSLFQAYIRKAGADLDAALKEAGTALPPQLSGEKMIRGFLEESRKEALSEAGQRRQQALHQITRELVASLPGGSANPEFLELLSARYKEWLDHHHKGAE
jgi:hypothetical protein